MKRFGNPVISFASAFLVLLAILGLFQRDGREKIQSLPAFFVGGGVIFAGVIRRSRRRKMLLLQIRNSRNEE